MFNKTRINCNKLQIIYFDFLIFLKDIYLHETDHYSQGQAVLDDC